MYRVLSNKGKTLEAGRLVALETGSFATPGAMTFYGRYSAGADQREPLPNAWSLRYLGDAAAKQSTEIILWQSSEAVQRPFFCDALGVSGWYPLPLSSIAFNSDEGDGVQGERSVLPAETQRVALGGPDFPVPFPSGLLTLVVGNDVVEGYAHVSARIREGAKTGRGRVEATAFGFVCPNEPHFPRPAIPGPLP